MNDSNAIDYHRHSRMHKALGVLSNGSEFLTVGNKCLFSNLRDAVEYIDSQTLYQTLHTGSYTYVDGAHVLVATAPVSVNVTGRQLYLKHDTDDFLYPIEILQDPTSTNIKPFYRLYGRTPGVLNFSIVSPITNYVVQLAPGRHEGDGNPIIIPSFTNILSFGKDTCIYEDDAPATNAGIIQVPATSAGVKLQGFGVQVSGPTRGSCIQFTDSTTDVFTTGQRVELKDLHIASTGASDDGIWKLATSQNVMDNLICDDIFATGHYDNFALFQMARTTVRNSEIISISDNADPAQACSISGNSLVDSKFAFYNNNVRTYKSAENFGGQNIGLLITTQVASTKHIYTSAVGNVFDCIGELDTGGFLNSQGTAIMLSGDGPSTAASLTLNSANNIFNVAGARDNFAIQSRDDGVAFTCNDRNFDGSAITTSAVGTGAVTVTL